MQWHMSDNRGSIGAPGRAIISDFTRKIYRAFSCSVWRRIIGRGDRLHTLCLGILNTKEFGERERVTLTF